MEFSPNKDILINTLCNVQIIYEPLKIPPYVPFNQYMPCRLPATLLWKW